LGKTVSPYTESTGVVLRSDVQGNGLSSTGDRLIDVKYILQDFFRRVYL